MFFKRKQKKQEVTLKLEGVNNGKASCDTITLLEGDTLELSVIVNVDTDEVKATVTKKIKLTAERGTCIAKMV